MSDNPHSNWVDARTKELYDGILAKMKGGSIFGKPINFDDPVAVAVGAYLVGAEEAQAEAMKEKQAIFDLFERA